MSQNSIDKSLIQEPYVIFKPEDFESLQKANRKLITAPLITMGFCSVVALIAKFGNLSSLLPNPIAHPTGESQFSKLVKSKNKYFFMNIAGFLTLSSLFGAFFAKQIHEFKIYSKYSRQVAFYMRWKIQKEIRKTASEL